MQKYHFCLTHWNKEQEFKTVQADTYSEALTKVYSNARVVGADCKAITLLSGLLVRNPYTPGDYDIQLFN
jgi:hypothetical protein